MKPARLSPLCHRLLSALVPDGARPGLVWAPCRPRHGRRTVGAKLAGSLGYTVLLPLLCGALETGCAAAGSSSPAAPNTQPAWQETAGRWVTRDRQAFAYTVWEPTNPPHSVVIAIHGLSGAASDFHPLGEYIAAQGVITYAYALRGQGDDPVVQRRGDLPHWRSWLDDVSDFTALLQQQHPGLPLFYYGESMGALIALHAAARSETSRALSGLILASPVVQIKRTLSWWQVALLRSVTAVWPTYRLSLDHADRPAPQLTRDDAYQEWLRQAPQTLKNVTLRLLRDIETLMQHSHDAAARLHMPVLVLYAGHDAFVTPPMVERFFDAIAAPDKEKRLFPESYHLLLHDADKADVLHLIGHWLARHQLSER